MAFPGAVAINSITAYSVTGLGYIFKFSVEVLLTWYIPVITAFKFRISVPLMVTVVPWVRFSAFILSTEVLPPVPAKFTR